MSIKQVDKIRFINGVNTFFVPNTFPLLITIDTIKFTYFVSWLRCQKCTFFPQVFISHGGSMHEHTQILSTFSLFSIRLTRANEIISHLLSNWQYQYRLNIVFSLCKLLKIESHAFEWEFFWKRYTFEFLSGASMVFNTNCWAKYIQWQTKFSLCVCRCYCVC